MKDTNSGNVGGYDGNNNPYGVDFIMEKNSFVKYASFLSMDHINVETSSIKALFLETEPLVDLGLKDVKIIKHLVYSQANFARSFGYLMLLV